LTVTGGRSCAAAAPLAEPDCATDIFGNKTIADTVANAAIRNKPTEFTRHPDPVSSPRMPPERTGGARRGDAYGIVDDSTN